MSESDSEDDCVVYGSPLAPLEENESVSKKQKQLSYQLVKDKKGRPERFHGAFTGGFSAGYFNTVATPEGWTPSTFVSTRTNRIATDKKVPEDFMDEEDLGQFGIAPRKIVASDTFVVSGTKQRKRAAEFHNSRNQVEPVHMTIGMKLLHSIGRINKHSKSFENDNLLVEEPSPPLLESFGHPAENKKSSHYFPKDNLHGLGYSGITVTGLEHGHINLFATPGKPGKQDTLSHTFAISGSAFEDDDNDDIYSTDLLSNYDKVIGDIRSNDVKESDRRHTQYDPEKKSNKLLDNFTFVSKPQLPLKAFAAPALPPSFKPFHISHRNLAEFTKPNLKGRSVLDKKVLFSENLNVFSLLSKPGVTHGPLEKAESKSALQAFTADADSEKKNDTVKQTNVFVPETLPFAKDPAKQERYELYIKAINSTEWDPSTAVAGSNMTEWEIASEREEFHRTANLYKPLSSIMSTRFTPAKLDDDATESGSDVLPLNDKQNAAKMKMYGKLTRSIRKWYPDKLICKRFNVASVCTGAKHSEFKHQFEKFSFFSVNALKEELPVNQPAKNVKDDERKSDNVATDSEAESGLSAFNTNSGNTELRIYDPSSAKRPPIDLFKAVFENSSDESEEEESAKGNEMTPAFYVDMKDAIYNKNVNNSDETKAIDNDISQKLFSSMATSTDNHFEPERAEAYGPVLPPPVNYKMESVSQDQSSQVYSLTSPRERKYTKHKKKTSHKKQKHKAKHKKKNKKGHKYRTKKSKESSNSASSQSSSESVSNELISDTELLQKLKAARSHRL